MDSAQEMSMNTPITLEGDTTLEDTLTSDTKDPEKEVSDNELKKHAESLLQVLSPKEQFIVEKRCGFDEEGEWTLEEIGEYFEISRERVRQIEATARDKMRRVYNRFFQRM